MKVASQRSAVSRSSKTFMSRILNAMMVVSVSLLMSIAAVSLCASLAASILPTAQALSVHEIELDGTESLEKGRELFAAGSFDDASLYFWRSVLLQEASSNAYSVQDAFGGFMQCYAVQDRAADGFVFIARESFQRDQKDMAAKYLEQALMVDPHNPEAQLLQRQMQSSAGAKRKTPVDDGLSKLDRPKRNGENKFRPAEGASQAEAFGDKTPEDLYEYGSTLFSRKNYEACADIFELSCRRSDFKLGPSCSNAVYCRTMVLDWGFNGTTFDRDMERIIEITEREAALNRREEGGTIKWNRATSVHPHMMLGYPVPPILKRYSAESSAAMDEMMARVSSAGSLDPLPPDLPYNPKADRERYVEDASKPDFKLRVGFVGSGFNSKAVLYLSQDIFRFYDRSKIEMHVFSLGPADNDLFIKVGMGGCDWRERVKGHVDHFHDVEHMKTSHIDMARYIHSKDIHILVEWDGYARQGERAQGLMALHPAPMQILHQEFLGTSGAQYIDYIVTDKVTSPPHLEYLYTEKFIYLPNHFFSKGHAVQKEVKQPTHDYAPPEMPYRIGTGSPQQNRCLADDIEEPSIVFCNFNKFLKNNPQTLNSWIRILREVPNSILCLLENPSQGVPYMQRYIHEAAGLPSVETDSRSKKQYNTFKPQDGEDLIDRIHFLPWERSPFDHQARNQDFCNVMLDSFPYNGHTVAQDSLYGGVPIITRSDGDDMSSRVTTSANIVLGLEELNAVDGPKQYEDIAIALGNDKAKLGDVRKRLVDAALQRNPMHPYWDANRYAQNLLSGFTQAWEIFLAGDEARHITVVETEEVARGTYDQVLIDNPSDRVKEVQGSDEL